MPKLRFRATTNIQPAIETETVDNTVTIETTVTTPTTIQLLSVTVPTGPTTNWGNTESNVNGWVCALAPFPIGTGAGCYYSLYGVKHTTYLVYHTFKEGVVSNLRLKEPVVQRVNPFVFRVKKQYISGEKTYI